MLRKTFKHNTKPNANWFLKFSFNCFTFSIFNMQLFFSSRRPSYSESGLRAPPRKSYRKQKIWFTVDLTHTSPPVPGVLTSLSMLYSFFIFSCYISFISFKKNFFVEHFFSKRCCLIFCIFSESNISMEKMNLIFFVFGEINCKMSFCVSSKLCARNRWTAKQQVWKNGPLTYTLKSILFIRYIHCVTSLFRSPFYGKSFLIHTNISILEQNYIFLYRLSDPLFDYY